jgi:hypothetical protein
MAGDHSSIDSEGEGLGDGCCRCRQVVKHTDTAVAVVAEDMRFVAGDGALGITFYDPLGDLIVTEGVVGQDVV